MSRSVLPYLGLERKTRFDKAQVEVCLFRNDSSLHQASSENFDHFHFDEPDVVKSSPTLEHLDQSQVVLGKVNVSGSGNSRMTGSHPSLDQLKNWEAQFAIHCTLVFAVHI